MWTRNLVVAVTLLAFTACTSMQPIRDFTPSRIREQVHVGDHVFIDATNGSGYDLHVDQIDTDALLGHAPSGKRYKIAFESIRTIQVEKTSGWQAGTGFGAILTVGLIAFLLALLKGWDPGGGGESGSSGS